MLVYMLCGLRTCQPNKFSLKFVVVQTISITKLTFSSIFLYSDERARVRIPLLSPDGDSRSAGHDTKDGSKERL